MKTGVVLKILVLQSVLLYSQEEQGIAGSNYLSTSSLFFNPSAISDSRCYMQFNLIDARAMLSNNIAYIPGLNPWASIKGIAPQNPVAKTANGKEFAQITLGTLGPSFVISTMDFGAGFFTRLRSNNLVKGIPYDALMQLLDPSSDLHTSYPEKIKASNVLIGSMTWAEYGLNYSRMFRKEPNELWTAGVSLKYLTGINLNYKFVDELEANLIDSTYHVIRLKASDRYNDPAWNSGKGLSADFGLSYKKMLGTINSYYVNSPRSNCKYIDYEYKLSVSLMDLGALKFTKATYQAKVDTTLYDSKADQTFTGNFDYLYTNGKPIWAICPSALVLQGDYNFENRIYLNALLVKNLVPDDLVGARASNLLCISPRYETRQFEVSLPFTLQRFRYPYLGLALRFRTFVFGVDNLIPFLVPSNTSHFGIYFKLGISLFRNQSCNTSQRSVDDCKPGTKNKKWFGSPKMGENMKKKRTLKKRILTWF